MLLLAGLCIGVLCSRSVLSSWAVGVEVAGGETVRADLLVVARREIGVQERSGRNDGERVGEYLAYTGLGEGYEWCAAFVSWCFGQVGMPEPRTPWSPSLFPAARVVWPRELSVRSGHAAPGGADGADNPRPGDVFGLWVREKGRIGHAGLVERWDGRWCLTVEGNSGDAVRRVRRPVSTIYRVADWISGKEGR